MTSETRRRACKLGLSLYRLLKLHTDKTHALQYRTTVPQPCRCGLEILVVTVRFYRLEQCFSTFLLQRNPT